MRSTHPRQLNGQSTPSKVHEARTGGWVDRPSSRRGYSRAVVPWGERGGGDRLLSTLSPRRQKFRPRRPLESRYKIVTERPRMLQRAERTCQDPYHGTQPYPASGTRVGTLWTPTEVGTAHLPGLGGVWPMSTFAIYVPFLTLTTGFFGLYSYFMTQLDVPNRQTTPTQHTRVLGSSFRCLDKEDKRPQSN